MSADSPRRSLQKNVQVISPQPVNDRSIIDSVAGIINDIVPQAYTSSPSSENKETITWARFEYADINDPTFFPDYIEGSSTPPLLLVLGYTSGVQVWLISASGEATEVLSWRQSIVRTLRILPDPKIDEDCTDPYAQKRPIIVICDSSGPGPQFCSINFISLRTGEQIKSIKFKNPVCDILANKRSIVVTFSEKIAVFNARTFEDVLTVTTCYPCSGPNPNPVALGTRWFAYSEKKLVPSRRSSGGSEGEGVQSYTAAVLYAAKSLGKGLRGLGETVASSFTGNSATSMSMNTGSDVTQPGVVTILDLQIAKQEKDHDDSPIEFVIAHFTAHNDAIVAMTFDRTGSILMTADRRGHDFHVFKIQPHPGGPTLAAVHHLYVLHRGDTTAKVQDMVFSSDTRWAAISTIRGTTHVFPVAPYGGSVGMRTHSTPHVVNRLSRFHKSAGLTDDGTRSHSPVSHSEIPVSAYPYSNPRLPPYPHPTILHPLAQIRQPTSMNHMNNQTQSSRPQHRQKLHPDDNSTLPLKICACFAPPRAWIYAQRDSTNKINKRMTESLFIMACHGNMIQYDLEPKPATGVPKEKVCDDTMIELEVQAKGQWPLLRSPNSTEIAPPLSLSNPLLCHSGVPRNTQLIDCAEDRWLSQVEIVTHAGPHRRLWMGPQFVFKTYNTLSGSNTGESEAIEIGVTGGARPAKSNPVNMPLPATRSLVPVVIDGSGSSYEQSPRLMETYEDAVETVNTNIGNGENQLREDLAEAMLETSTTSQHVPGRRLIVERVGQPVTKVVNPLGTVITILADEEDAANTKEDEYEHDQEFIPEGPKSVCAEEGPASLGDFDAEGNLLRNLTEICAEMSTASEPAIDTVPDENIREVKEQKSLCVEAATMNTSGGVGNSATIDYEKAEAFCDIPNNLSLCAEPGEIPISPMTQAKETSWNRKIIKKPIKDNLSSAKYLVSYDDDNVIFAENSMTLDPADDVKTKQKMLEIISDLDSSEQSSKRTIKNINDSRAIKRNSAAKEQHSKYLLCEQGDSIVIEDNINIKAKKTQPQIDKTMIIKKTAMDPPVETDDCDETKAEIIKIKTKIIKINEPVDSFVELKVIDTIMEKNVIEDMPEPMEATIATACGVAAALPSIASDDLNCSDYHIIEPNTFAVKNNIYRHQSDDDIVHLRGNDAIPKTIDNEMDDCASQISELSPIQPRKCVKSTISDDDIEHIQTSDLFEMFERCETLVNESPGNQSHCQSKSTPSSSDDLENISSESSDVHQPLLPIVTRNPEIEHPETSEETFTKIDTVVKSPVINRTSRKRKDIVVIDSEQPDNDVTVVIKGLDRAECWNKNKSPEKELSDEIERCFEQPLKNQSLPKKTRVRTSKNSEANNCVEIIDIDALQKAEREIANSPVPDCKILETCPEIPVAKIRKSKRNKDSSVGSESSIKNANKPEIIDTPADWRLPTVDKNGKTKKGELGKDKTRSSDDERVDLKLKVSKIQAKKAAAVEDSPQSLANFDSNLKESSSLTCPVSESGSIAVSPSCFSTDKTIDKSKIQFEVKNVDDNDDKSNLIEVKSTGSQLSPVEQPQLEVNEVPMDTEEDVGLKNSNNNVEKCSNSTTTTVASPSWSTAAAAAGKKNNRSKKKKRR